MSPEQWTKEMKKLLKKCPKGHWLFAASGSLYLMKLRPDGGRYITPSEGMDQNYIVGDNMGCGIEIDGGDW
jgi:hypothetical protein